MAKLACVSFISALLKLLARLEAFRRRHSGGAGLGLANIVALSNALVFSFKLSNIASGLQARLEGPIKERGEAISETPA
jgi:hypothetical protein